MNIFYLDENTGAVQEYFSMSHMKKARYLTHRGGHRRGCFIHNGNIGRIHIKPFSLSIKSLDTDLDLKLPAKISEWGNILGLIQHMVIKNPEKPT